jgi:hypothetical protein
MKKRNGIKRTKSLARVDETTVSHNIKKPGGRMKWI